MVLFLFKKCYNNTKERDQMKKYLYVFFAFLACLFVSQNVQASSPSYDVLFYGGTLTLDTWDDATYEEELVYYFKDSYRGQYVSLGTAGNMPQGFAIEIPPKVEVEGRELQREPEITNLGDGYRVKIYNSGVATDTVKIKVTWKLKNLLYSHKDILELNWKPITDGDQKVDEVQFRVIPKFAPANAQSELYIHTAFMGPDVTVKKEDGIYSATFYNLGKGKAVELYGYWLKSDLTTLYDSGRNTGLTKLDEFHKNQAKIEQEKYWTRMFWNWILPAFIIALWLLALLGRNRFKKMIWPGVTYPTNTRLYEIPQDIAPLVMSSVVYSAELDEASPTNKEKATPPVFTFEKMLQATLLDLMDRGVIVYEQQGNEVVLTRKSHGHVDDFERSFMNMAFGDQVSCPVNRLFENYEFSDDVYKHAKKADQDAIRSLGSKAQARFDTAVNQVARDVHRKVEDLHLPSYYRPLEAKEEAQARRSLFFGWAAWFIALGAEIFAIFGMGWFSVPCLIGILTLWFMPVRFNGVFKACLRDGVVNLAGAEQRYYWDSFGRMLKEIAHLNDAELQSLVLWNRLLVYAALYGVADQVTKVMKLRNIHLENQALNAFVYTPFYHDVTHSSHAMSTYGSTASTASHFTVSSGSGGGFSGGGGGGGFGAF